MIAPSVNYTSSDNCEIKSRVPHNFFSRPFRFMIWRTTVWTRTQKTHEHNLFDIRSSRSRYDILCAFDVHSAIGLRLRLPIDAGAVRHCITTSERLDKNLRIGKIRCYYGRQQAFLRRTISTRDEDYLMALCRQTITQMLANKSGTASDCNPHCLAFLKIIVGAPLPRSPGSRAPPRGGAHGVAPTEWRPYNSSFIPSFNSATSRKACLRIGRIRGLPASEISRSNDSTVWSINR